MKCSVAASQLLNVKGFGRCCAASFFNMKDMKGVKGMKVAP